jgi:phosphoribosylaminoimidazolecarboxamide formyltransferase/IMP cyclohydrolase
MAIGQRIKTNNRITGSSIFKHVSPAGAAIGLPLSDVLKKAYFRIPKLKSQI